MDEGGAGGLMAPQRRALTVGLVLTITFVASEALAVVTVMPVVARDLGGLRLYGWVFSGFMLGSVIGIVAAGREADRRGPAVPFVAGVVLFGSGLALAGLAPSMGVLVAGRVLQGVGAGAVPSVAYAVIGRSLPGTLRPRMMAVLSTAWVAPGLAGPAVSAEVARLFGWRWVFLGLLPIVAVAGTIAVPALIRLGPPASGGAEEHRMIDGFRTAAGATLILAGLTLAAGSGAGPGRLGAILGGVALIAAGAAAGLPALRRLVPPGTLTARAGLPATILSRGLLTFTFFGADAYVTLAVTAVRHRTPVVAGIAVTGATVAWTAGAWIQARLSAYLGRTPPGPHRAGDRAGRHRRDGPGPAARRAGGRGPGRLDRGRPRDGPGLRADLADDAAEGAARPGRPGLGVAEPGRRARHRDRHRRGRRGGGRHRRP